jgi:hypothetical protein
MYVCPQRIGLNPTMSICKARQLYNNEFEHTRNSYVFLISISFFHASIVGWLVGWLVSRSFVSGKMQIKMDSLMGVVLSVAELAYVELTYSFDLTPLILIHLAFEFRRLADRARVLACGERRGQGKLRNK